MQLFNLRHSLLRSILLTIATQQEFFPATIHTKALSYLTKECKDQSRHAEERKQRSAARKQAGDREIKPGVNSGHPCGKTSNFWLCMKHCTLKMIYLNMYMNWSIVQGNLIKRFLFHKY